MSVEATNSLSPFHFGPFSDQVDTLAYGFQLLSVDDVCNCSMVSKAWNNAINNNSGIWLHNFDKEKIPRIEGIVKTARTVFQFMCRKTYSARKIPHGRFIGEVPMLTKRAFEWYAKAKDPIDPEKYVRDTFVILVEPTHIQVSCDGETDQKKLLEIVYEERGVKAEVVSNNTVNLPHTTRNLLAFSRYLESNGEKISVEINIRDFNNFDDEEELQQIQETVLKTANVYFMRIQSFGDRLYDHLSHIKNHGLEIMPLRPRLYYNLIETVAKGHCIDAIKTSDADVTLTSDVAFRDRDGDIGTFGFETSQKGMIDIIITYPQRFSEEDDDTFNAAVGIPAEVLPNKALLSNGKRTHETAFTNDVNPITVEIPEFQAHEEIRFTNVMNVCQSSIADWKNAVMVAKNISIETAQRIAQEKPEIDFFFYVHGNSVVYGDPLGEYRSFPHQTAVFFKGEPSWDESVFSDGYVKSKGPVSIFDNPSS
jgi:hypothetical protein